MRLLPSFAIFYLLMPGVNPGIYPERERLNGFGIEFMPGAEIL
jgi:hypothetical protein